MKFNRSWSPLVVVLAALGCNPDDGGDTDTTSLSALDQAVEAMGGEDALTGLERLRISASGSRSLDYEGMTPSDLYEVTTYSSTVLHDLTTDDLRVDMTRTLLFEALQFFPEETYSMVLTGEVGGLTDQVGFFSPGALPSANVGALRQQRRLFSPHVLLRDALSDPASVVEEGEETFDGRDHRILTLTEDGVEIRLFVDADTGFISKLETLENSPVLRDVPIEVRYDDWEVHDTLAVPGKVELYTIEGLVQEEVRSAVEVEPDDVAADAFELPAEAGTPQVDSDLYAFGRLTHEVVEGFFQIWGAFTPGGAFETSELAPGVTLLASGYNSVAVEVDDSLVLLEAPLSPDHGSAIVAELDASFPGKPITHVIQSHHHQDHSGGVRSLAAAGATLVVGPGVGPFYEDILAAPSTLRPDALSQAPTSTTVEEVAEDGTRVIAGADTTITAYHLSANAHSKDMLITVVDTGDARFVYEADLYNAGFGFTVVVDGPVALMGGLRDLGIIDASCESAVPLSIIPTHGMVLTLEDSIVELQGLGYDIGCP